MQRLREVRAGVASALSPPLRFEGLFLCPTYVPLHRPRKQHVKPCREPLYAHVLSMGDMATGQCDDIPAPLRR